MSHTVESAIEVTVLRAEHGFSGKLDTMSRNEAACRH